MPNDFSKLRRIMRRANYVREYAPVLFRGRVPDKSQALHYAWYFEREFRSILKQDTPQRFCYFKRDGSLREAVGTLNFDLIPGASPQRNGESGLRQEGKEKSAAIFTYFDLYRQNWCSFDIRNFIGFVEPLRDTDIPGCRDT